MDAPGEPRELHLLVGARLGRGFLGLLGAPVVAELAKGHGEHGARKAPVELRERIRVAAGDAFDQVSIRLGRRHGRKRHIAAGYGTQPGSGLPGAGPSSRPPSTTSEVPVTNSARVR